MDPLKTIKFEGDLENETGQATVEYILMLAIILIGFLMLSQGLATTGLMAKLAAPISGPFAKAYQNGHYQATAPDDPGGAFKHPRATGPESFRIFYTRGSL